MATIDDFKQKIKIKHLFIFFEVVLAVEAGYQLLSKKLKSYSNYHISSEYAHDIMTLTNNKYVFPVKNWSLSKLFET